MLFHGSTKDCPTPNTNGSCPGHFTEPSLEERIAKLEQLVRLLTEANPEVNLPEACRKRQCTYYQHYLAYGPAELTHEGFHVAEKHCEAAQLRIEKWMNDHPDEQVPELMMNIATRWEARVRA